MDKDARYMAAKCRRLADMLGEYDARTLRELAAEYDRQAAIERAGGRAGHGAPTGQRPHASPPS